MIRKATLAGAVAAAIIAGDVLSGGTGLFVGRAQAEIGRPLTPLSYAGVARRTARRTTRRNLGYYGAYGAPVVAAPPVVVAPPPVVVAPGGPGCMQSVDAYGRIIYTCP